MKPQLERLETLLPSPMEPTNAYLIRRDPITLIDCGFSWPEGRDSFRTALATAKMSLKDIRRVIFTHGHQDHYSLAAAVFGDLPVEYFLAPEEHEKVDGRYTARIIDHLPALEQYYLSEGMPAETASLMLSTIANGLSGYREVLPTPQPLRHGTVLPGDGYTLKVFHTPGHSQGSMCLWWEETRLLFSGDTLLPRSVPYPVLDITPDHSFNHRYGMRDFFRSLDSLRPLPLARILPGHGAEIQEPAQLFARYDDQRGRYRSRLERQLQKGPATAFDLYFRLYKRMPGYVIHLGMPIVLGLLEDLTSDNNVERLEDEGKTLYRLKE